MKVKYIILIIVLVLLALFVIYTLFIKKPKPITGIKIMHFSYNQGNMINSHVSYALDCDNEKCTATIKPYDIPDENEKKINVDQELVDKVVEVLKKYNVERWNGFQKSDKYVLDGNGFTMYIRNEDNSTIEASGYMKWPDNYKEVREELDTIFMDLYNKY